MSLTQRVRNQQLHPAMLPREMRWRDVAYLCFVVCGGVLLGAVLLNWIPTDTWVYIALAWLYSFPVLFVFTVAALAGAAFSLVAWREWRLLLLSSLTLLTAWIPWLVRQWPVLPDLVVGSYLALYLVLSIGGPLWWFLIDRRRILERYPPQVERGWLESEGRTRGSSGSRRK